MKIFLIILIIALCFLGIIIYKYRKPLQMPQKQSSVTVTPASATAFCSVTSLKAFIDLSAGAGNVYGTLSLKNISSNTCHILGNDFVTPVYSPTVKNIMVTHIGNTQEQDFLLKPNDTIYSQVHFPNGPQCQEKTVPTNVVFKYAISPNESISFTNKEGNDTQIVQTCATETEKTEIQIWNLQTTPVTP